MVHFWKASSNQVRMSVLSTGSLQIPVNHGNANHNSRVPKGLPINTTKVTKELCKEIQLRLPCPPYIPMFHRYLEQSQLFTIEKYPNIYAWRVQPGQEASILTQIPDHIKTKLKSAFINPAKPGVIFIEIKTPDALPSLEGIRALSWRELLLYFCIPSRFMHFIAPGKIVSISHGMYIKDYAQVLCLQNEKHVYVKVFPRIDYANMKALNVTKQSICTAKMDRRYRPPKDLFDILKVKETEVVTKSVSIGIGDNRYLCHVWDDRLFNTRGWEYVSVPLDCVNCPVAIPEHVRCQFYDVMTTEEKSLPGFEMRCTEYVTESTPESVTVQNVPCVHAEQDDFKMFTNPVKWTHQSTVKPCPPKHRSELTMGFGVKPLSDYFRVSRPEPIPLPKGSVLPWKSKPKRKAVPSMVQEQHVVSTESPLQSDSNHVEDITEEETIELSSQPVADLPNIEIPVTSSDPVGELPKESSTEEELTRKVTESNNMEIHDQDAIYASESSDELQYSDELSEEANKDQRNQKNNVEPSSEDAVHHISQMFAPEGETFVPKRFEELVPVKRDIPEKYYLYFVNRDGTMERDLSDD